MIARFCAYAVLRNLRLFDPFLVLFLLHDVGLSYLAIGALLGWGKLLSGALEVPLGLATDRWGRRRALIVSFSLASGAFAVFACAPGHALAIPMLYLAESVYAIAEAARSGSHKAIILDWLTREGRRGEKTAVIGKTRFFSKTAGGAAALIGGVIVWATGSFTPLFWCAIVPTLAAVALIWGYPRVLDASHAAAPADGDSPGFWSGLKAAARRPKWLALLLVSVAFESQIKLALLYLQPFLADALGAVSIDVAAGAGAIAYGAWFMAQGLAAGVASLFSARLAGANPARALRRLHWLGAGLLFVVGVIGLWVGAAALAVLPAFLLLAAAQNARRPIFVAALDDTIDPRFRATALSVENQARSWAYAICAVGAGGLADWAGPGMALVGMAVTLGIAVALASARDRA